MFHLFLSVDTVLFFVVVHQDAIQKVWYSDRQISMLTCVVHMNIGGTRDHQSFVVVSDCLEHSTASVYACYKKVNEFIDEKFNERERKHTFIKTDGCAGTTYSIPFHSSHSSHFI